MLVPPTSAFGDFVRDIRLLRLIEIIEMPGQISDRAEPDDEQEESTLSDPAQDKTREKILDVFQKYLSARENGSMERRRMRDRWKYALHGRGNEEVISSLLPLCDERGVSFGSFARKPRRFLLSISR
jgi:hypothetical protein